MSDFFYRTLEALFLPLGYIFSLDMRLFALFYFILLCCVWLLSLRKQLFSEGKQKEGESGKQGKWGMLGVEKRGKIVISGYCVRDAFIFNKKQTLTRHNNNKNKIIIIVNPSKQLKIYALKYSRQSNGEQDVYSYTGSYMLAPSFVHCFLQSSC